MSAHPPRSLLLTPDATTGLLLRHARSRRGWSQREFARRAGLGLRTIHRIERDDYGRSPRRATWQALATALELPDLPERRRPIDALREALLRNLQPASAPATPAPPPAPRAPTGPQVPPEDVGETLVGQLDTALAALKGIRDAIVVYGRIAEEHTRLRARLDEIRTILSS